MGSASSKAARASAAKSAKKPSWSGARVPAYDPKTSPSSTARRPPASETKDEEIQRDAKDPQLMANLSRMKPVRVHQHVLPAGTDRMRELFESRARAEEEAAAAGTRTPRNRLHVGTLVALLEERLQNENGNGIGIAASAGSTTTTTTTTTTRQLGEKYGMDVERVERLVRSVNVPSVREGHGGGGGVTYVRDVESGADIVVTEVEWREPRTVLRDHPRIDR